MINFSLKIFPRGISFYFFNQNVLSIIFPLTQMRTIGIII